MLLGADQQNRRTMISDAEVEDMLETIRTAFRGEAVYKTSLAAHVLSRVVTNSFQVPAAHYKPLVWM